jgi:hypothetical protein
MKKGVKILLTIGIIWIVVAFFLIQSPYPIERYCDDCIDLETGQRVGCCYGGMNEFLPAWVIASIPSLILFVIAFVLSRKKK